MAPSVVNILLTSFSGLGLPPTLSIPVLASISVSELRSLLVDRLPQSHHRLVFTTTSNKELLPSSTVVISDLVAEDVSLLPIRLSLPVRGGKGGFGSQLRAAGGRMSSKRKRNQGDENSSNRNLDGRRLRTVAEAKALAEYLALKPEMDKKEKEARRKRWEQVVELAGKREEEIRSSSKGKVDGRWVEDKDEAGDRTREAVFAAMKSGQYHDTLGDLLDASPEQRSTEASLGQGDDDSDPFNSKVLSSTRLSTTSRPFFGLDNDDDMSSDEEDAGEIKVAQHRG
ncbi:MAG: hypothetical protein LQ345_005217 [Seirophora villosa]|nr:MAG: hypothetical protein LQ345_005217 [Seirophora villosa]